MSPHSPPSREEALSALHAIPPDLKREDWVRAGMAAIANGLTIPDLVDWSSAAPNFISEQDVRSTFGKVKPEGGIGPRTLFFMAREHGWKPEASDAHPSPVARLAAAVQRNTAATSSAQTSEHLKDPVHESTEAVWRRCLPASEQHPYALAKNASGALLGGLRVVPQGDSLRIMRLPMAGALVVPLLRQDGSVASLQFIPPPQVQKRLKDAGAPGKLNLPGAPLEGWFAVGARTTGGVAYLCEGIGTAWTCNEATGHAAIVCFGWGRVAKVAAELRATDATAKLVIVPDVGKEGDADKIAATVGARVARMPEGWAKNSDFNDLAKKDGLAVAAAILNAAVPPPRLRPVSVGDVMTNPSPAPECVWDGYLPRGVVSLWGAHGGTGKSTMALMLCVATVMGRELFGAYTQRSRVLFVSLEDNEHVVRHRLAHICREWGVTPESLDGELLIVDGCEYPELFTSESRSDGTVTQTYVELQQIASKSGAGLVVVDNASDAFGGDEIQRRQVRAFMRAMGRLAKQSHCAVVVLAHVDKATSRALRTGPNNEGYSGSTAWHNSARSRLFMSRDDTTGLLKLEHQKANLTQRRESITLEWPHDGLPRLASDTPCASAGTGHQQGRADDAAAVVLLRLLAEYGERGHYASPLLRAPIGVYKLLESDPTFKRLKLRREDVTRIVHQCQRAGWIEPEEYKSKNSNKRAQRWTITKEGRLYAGLEAPTSPTSPTSHEDEDDDVGGGVGSPTSPTYVGGMGGESAHGLAP